MSRAVLLALIEGKRAELAALEAALASADGSVSKRWYSAEALPPGVRTWRAAREAALRAGLPTVRVGRDVRIDADGWDRWIADRAKPAVSRARRRGPVVVQDADREALARMGVQLRAVAGGRR